MEDTAGVAYGRQQEQLRPSLIFFYTQELAVWDHHFNVGGLNLAGTTKLLQLKKYLIQK